MKKIITTLLSLFPLTSIMLADSRLTIDAAKPVSKVSPLLYGLMTEEINYSYDGGLYAELVRNRAFLDDPEAPAHWSIAKKGDAAVTMALDFQQPLNDSIPVSLRVDVSQASSSAPAGVANSGYWGIPVKPGTSYKASFYAKSSAADSGPLNITIESEGGTQSYAGAVVPKLTNDWQLYEVTLTTGKDVTPTTKAHLSLTMERPGTIWLGLVSLFPPTWKNRVNGLRPDLMQMLVDLKPGFLRFPGGNYLEGDTIATRFDWKKTLGPLSTRAGHQGPWHYRSTDGMGLLEFLLWCEDMNAEPVLAVYAGYSLKGELVKPGPDLEPYVQDACDEIEYVTGPVTSKWGAQRAKDGHPQPFKLRYVEIGNEDFLDKSGTYDVRFTPFFDAIKKKYPGLICISTVGNEHKESQRVHSRVPDLLDEHYYRNADDFINDSPSHFEKYDRNGPKVFVGEWAAYETKYVPWDKRSKGEPPTPNMKAALGDAAWMAAMERNADIVVMHCYAPLFVNVNEYQWRPNLIGYDALNAFGSPSYYAFRMFSNNVGDVLLGSTLSDGSAIQCTVTRDSKTGVIYAKLVNPRADAQPLKIEVNGARLTTTIADVETLYADPAARNSLTTPQNVVPEKTKIPVGGNSFVMTVQPFSVTVLRLK